MNLEMRLKRYLQQSTTETRDQKNNATVDILQGREEGTPFGPVFVKEKVFPLHYVHGDLPIKEALQVSNETICYIARDPALDGLNLKRSLFLDTETTGLAGGTGTYIFLVGIGFFCDDAFVLRQYLMRDYNEEPAFLYRLAGELRNVQALITFNGKMFDWPLLQTRFTITRMMEQGLKPSRHLDLLQLARRLWREKLSSCSLSSLEKNMLGVARQDDIPGVEIPRRYFSFLQTRDPRLLVDILHHNVIDILSLVTLMKRIEVTGNQSPRACNCCFESFALGRLAESTGDLEKAEEYYKKALSFLPERDLKPKIISRLAYLYKRCRSWQEAENAWKMLLNCGGNRIEALIELAKIYEHRKKNMDEAFRVTRRALAFALQNGSEYTSQVGSIEHRLGRLQGKMVRKEKTGVKDLSYPSWQDGME